VSCMLCGEGGRTLFMRRRGGSGPAGRLRDRTERRRRDGYSQALARASSRPARQGGPAVWHAAAAADRLAAVARQESTQLLNRILADTTILYAMYKKHHWNVSGPTFYQLHLLFDKHADEQLELIDLLAERVQSLGGIAVGDPRHAAELTRIERPPDGTEEVPVMISRLLDAHETIITAVREAIDKTGKSEDWGSNDLLMSDVLRRHELQVWFLSEHLVDVPLVEG
jgi:starvation-inducible DNA-binding protein